MSSPSPSPPDVVATRGAFLQTRFMTPTVLSFFNPDFYERLCHDLRLLQDRQEIREEIYGKELAAESRLAHTPPEVRDQYQTEEHQGLRKWMAVLTPATPSTSNITPAFLSPNLTTPSRNASPTSPITPPISHHELPPTAKSSQKRKRTSDEADEQGALVSLKRMKLVEPHRPLRRSPRLVAKKGRG